MGEQRTPWYFDCRMCGHVGRVEQLKEHPLRPVDSDFGFCPECMAPVDDPISRQEAVDLFADYGEDGLAEVNKLDAQVSAHTPATAPHSANPAPDGPGVPGDGKSRCEGRLRGEG